ncbi:HGxxPAAW family protein [Mumia sp. Pv 4-285]|uniref:HGxxPAAW family protein n=1 Tax=Mumia qirimensis TaxID=3234852 RepID=UPI00351D79FB
MHGSSPAAWTAVVICLIGFTVGGVALLMGPAWVMFWIGVALVLGSAIVAKVMGAAGLGAKAH